MDFIGYGACTYGTLPNLLLNKEPSPTVLPGTKPTLPTTEAGGVVEGMVGVEEGMLRLGLVKVGVFTIGILWVGVEVGMGTGCTF